MASWQAVRLAPGECPSGFAYYHCANGFKGCCGMQPCDPGTTGCPLEHLPPPDVFESAGVSLLSPTTTIRNRPTASMANKATVSPASPTTTTAATGASTTATSPPTTAPIAPAQKAQAPSDRAGLSIGVILGVVFGVLLLLVCLVVICCVRRARRRRRDERESEAARWSELERAGSQSSHAAMAEMIKMEEEGRRVVNRVQKKTAGSRIHSGAIENPRGGVFEEVGGRYLSPEPVVANTDGGAAFRLLTRRSSVASSSYSRRGSLADTELVSPLSPNPANRERTFHWTPAKAADTAMTAPTALTSPDAPELDSLRATISELELPNTPSSPTFGPRAPRNAVQFRTLEVRNSSNSDSSDNSHNSDNSDNSNNGDGYNEYRIVGLSELEGEIGNTIPTWRDEKLTPARLPGYELPVLGHVSPLGIRVDDGEPRATLNATVQEKRRGIHVGSWGVYE